MPADDGSVSGARAHVRAPACQAAMKLAHFPVALCRCSAVGGSPVHSVLIAIARSLTMIWTCIMANKSPETGVEKFFRMWEDPNVIRAFIEFYSMAVELSRPASEALFAAAQVRTG